MPGKKIAKKTNNIQSTQNKKDIKKDNKPQKQKNEPKFTKSCVEIKNDPYSTKELYILTKNNNQYISCLNINGFTKQFRDPKDSKKVEAGKILEEENILGLFLTAHNIEKWNHKMYR